LNLIGRKKGLQRMVKNKWYERSHWTYKANRGWLIERGIMAFHWSNSQGFHWSIFPREKRNVLWETPKSFRVDPEVFPKIKLSKNPVRKKYKVISGDFRWCYFLWSHFRWLPVMQLPVTQLPLTSRSYSRSSSNTSPIQHDILLRYDILHTFNLACS
jgi:hypothetical protein